MHTRAAPRERLQDADLYDDVVAEVLAFLRERIDVALAARRRRRAADRRPGPRLRQDARADDRAAARRRAPARARPPAADGDLAQGLRRRAHRPCRRASASPARSRRSAHGVDAGAHIFRVHDVAAAADFLAVRAALCGRARAEQGSRARRGNAYDRRGQRARPRAARLKPIIGCPPLSNAAGRQPPIPTEGDPHGAVLDRSELEASPLADLHAIADQLGLDGFRRLRKADLIDRILGDAPAAGDDSRRRLRRRRRRRPSAPRRARAGAAGARGARARLPAPRRQTPTTTEDEPEERQGREGVADEAPARNRARAAGGRRERSRASRDDEQPGGERRR